MDWQEFTDDVAQLAHLIDFVPDIIIGITRGGVVPARVLATYLQVDEMHCLWVQRKGKERKIASTLVADLVGKKVLIVDDMMETSGVMTTARKHVESRGAVVRTACLYTMPHSLQPPDYSLRVVPEVQQFPWEKDITQSLVTQRLIK